MPGMCFSRSQAVAASFLVCSFARRPSRVSVSFFKDAVRVSRASSITVFFAGVYFPSRPVRHGRLGSPTDGPIRWATLFAPVGIPVLRAIHDIRPSGFARERPLARLKVGAIVLSGPAWMRCLSGPAYQPVRGSRCGAWPRRNWAGVINHPMRAGPRASSNGWSSVRRNLNICLSFRIGQRAGAPSI